MEQLALPQVAEPALYGRFTFALQSYRHDSWSNTRSKTGLALVFGPAPDRTCNSFSQLERIMDAPLLDRIIGPGPIWFAQHKKLTVVSNRLVCTPRSSEGEPSLGIGLVTYTNGQRKKQTWSFRELYNNCFDLEKIGSQCKYCTRDPAGCIRYCIETAARLRNQEIALPVPTDKLMLFEELEVDEIQKFLRQESKGTQWEYVPSQNTTMRDFAPKLLGIDAIDFTRVDTRRAEISERHQKAAKTRKALARCKQCWFFEYCDFCRRPYYGRPRLCQDEKHRVHHMLTVPGPYTQRQVFAAAEAFWQSLPHIEREKIELIAYNTGIITEIFGFELQLGRMTAEMNAVEFFRPNDPATAPLRVSFEDAVLLCTTPFRSHGKYYYPRRGWRAPPKQMSDEVFYAYIEMCQHAWAKSAGYSSVKLLSAEWDGDCTIKAETDHGICIRVCNLREVMNYNYGFPTIVGTSMPSQEEAETFLQGTNSGTQL